MEPIVVPLRSRRQDRAGALQKLQHAIPAAGLIAAGLDSLRHGAQGFELALAAVEIGTSVMLIATIVRSVRAARASGQIGLHHGHGIDWIEVWAAGVLFAEAAERWHLTHHVARPMILTGLVTLGLGLFHHRMEGARSRRRSLRVSSDGLYVGGRPFRTLTAAWTDVASITIGEKAAEIRTRSGRTRRLHLADLDRSADVRAALVEAQARVANANQV